MQAYYTVETVTNATKPIRLELVSYFNLFALWFWSQKMAVMVSEEAALELKRAHSESNLTEDTFVRVGVLAGGCAGFEYSLSFDDKFDEQKDSQYDQHGVKVVVDKKSALLLDGAVIGWHKSLERQGFTFENPNATKSCGCGKSFQ